MERICTVKLLLFQQLHSSVPALRFELNSQSSGNGNEASSKLGTSSQFPSHFLSCDDPLLHIFFFLLLNLSKPFLLEPDFTLHRGYLIGSSDCAEAV